MCGLYFVEHEHVSSGNKDPDLESATPREIFGSMLSTIKPAFTLDTENNSSTSVNSDKERIKKKLFQSQIFTTEISDQDKQIVKTDVEKANAVQSSIGTAINDNCATDITAENATYANVMEINASSLKTTTDAVKEQGMETILEQGTESSLDQGTGTILEQGTESSLEKGTGTILVQGTETILKQGTETSLEQGTETHLEQGTEINLRQGTETSREQGTETSREQCTEPIIEQDTETSLDQGTETCLEQVAETSLEQDTETCLDQDIGTIIKQGTETSLEQGTEISLDQDIEQVTETSKEQGSEMISKQESETILNPSESLTKKKRVFCPICTKVMNLKSLKRHLKNIHHKVIITLM